MGRNINGVELAVNAVRQLWQLVATLILVVAHLALLVALLFWMWLTGADPKATQSALLAFLNQGFGAVLLAFGLPSTLGSLYVFWALPAMWRWLFSAIGRRATDGL